MKKFALTGAAGFIAPRHMKAIQETGNDLVAIYDPHDAVGIIDQYFPKASYFKDYVRFDRYLEKIRLEGESIDFLSVCTPNHVHDSQIRMGLRLDADVICEKPLVLNPWNLDALEKIEAQSKARVWGILQLRYHDEIIKLKKKVESNPEKKWQIKLEYITGRGNWYHYSWKGDEEKSGGVITNIGIHFFDMLLWIFGECEQSVLKESSQKKWEGELVLKNADVHWKVSVDLADLPGTVHSKNKRIYRNLLIDDESFDFTKGFEDLHTKTYEHIIAGNGYGIADVRPSIELVQRIRNKSTKS